MERKSLRKAQGGFTLIEIIAVLVILGILAAVAIPRFVNLQEQSRLSAAEGVASGYASGISLAYANGLLGGNAANAITIAANCDVTAGGATNPVARHEGPYDVTCSVGNLGANVTITVVSTGGNMAGTPSTGTLANETTLTMDWSSPEV